jgi:hypothetical protein
MERTYRIAEHTILIRTLYERMHLEAAAFAASGCPDFTVTITQADIDAERTQSARTDEIEGRANHMYADAYLETLAVYRKIAEYLPKDGTVLFHGSAIAVDGEAYLFAAKSGTGKSTHARLWRELLGDRAVMINDDKPLLHIAPEGATVFGTPWNGKHRLGINGSAPLKTICFLERGEQNRIVRIEPKAAYPMLLQQTYRPASLESLKQTLTLLDTLMQTVAFYRLACNMKPEAAKVSYEAMKGSTL